MPLDRTQADHAVFLKGRLIKLLKILSVVSGKPVDVLADDAVEEFLNNHFEELLEQYSAEFTSQSLKVFREQRQAAKPSK